MAVSLISAPAAEPIDTADAKQQARVEGPDSDGLIDRYIASARDRAERFTRTKLITQTWRITLDCFHPVVQIPLWPVQSIHQITYLDADGVEQTLAPSKYHLIASQKPNRIAPAYLETWPVPRTDFDAVKIDVIVGYGDSGDDVPSNLIQAMHLMIAEMIADREDDEVITRRAESMMSDYIFWI